MLIGATCSPIYLLPEVRKMTLSGKWEQLNKFLRNFFTPSPQQFLLESRMSSRLDIWTAIWGLEFPLNLTTLLIFNCFCGFCFQVNKTAFFMNASWICCSLIREPCSQKWVWLPSLVSWLSPSFCLLLFFQCPSSLYEPWTHASSSTCSLQTSCVHFISVLFYTL